MVVDQTIVSLLTMTRLSGIVQPLIQERPPQQQVKSPGIRQSKMFEMSTRS